MREETKGATCDLCGFPSLSRCAHCGKQICLIHIANNWTAFPGEGVHCPDPACAAEVGKRNAVWRGKAGRV